MPNVQMQAAEQESTSCAAAELADQRQSMQARLMNGGDRGADVL